MRIISNKECRHIDTEGSIDSLAELVQRMVRRGRDFNFDEFNHDGPLMP